DKSGQDRRLFTPPHRFLAGDEPRLGEHPSIARASRKQRIQKRGAPKVETEKNASASTVGYRDVLRARVHVAETSLEPGILINGCAVPSPAVAFRPFIACA